MSFRYSVAPLASMKSFVFKPGQPDADGGSESVRAACLGAYYSGNFQKVVRNKRATLVWEARRSNDHVQNRFHFNQKRSLILKLHFHEGKTHFAHMSGGFHEVSSESADHQTEDLSYGKFGNPCQKGSQTLFVVQGHDERMKDFIQPYRVFGARFWCDFDIC